MKKDRRAAALVRASLSGSSPVAGGEGEIRALRAGSNAAIAAGDVEGIADSLSEDFVVVIGDGTLLTRAEYLSAFANGFEQTVRLSYERIMDSIRLSSSLPLAAEQGRWIGRLTHGAILFTGTYMAMWRKTEAGWKLRSELFVSLTYAEPA